MRWVRSSTHGSRLEYPIPSFHIFFVCFGNIDRLKTDGKLDIVVIDTVNSNEKNGAMQTTSLQDESNKNGIVQSAYANGFLWETAILLNRNLTNILRVNNISHLYTSFHSIACSYFTTLPLLTSLLPFLPNPLVFQHC